MIQEDHDNRYHNYHQLCYSPYVKIQEAQKGELSKGAKYRDEADDDEDVQSRCISHLSEMVVI